MTGDATRPLVTIAFPLYRSMRFFDYLAENIEKLSYPNLEILVGDRHLLDDAVQRLQARFPDDARIRYITATDELNWVEHYNLLLREAKGTYFFWMPHDDSIADGYVEALVGRLEAAPDAVLAFGYMDSVSVDGRRTSIWTPPPLTPGQSWSVRSALRMLLGWQLGMAMRGIFCREWVVKAGLWMRPTTGLTDADNCWLVGVAMLGRFEFVPETRFSKRYYAGSTSDQWRPLPFMERTRVVSSYVIDYAPTLRARVFGVTLLWAGAFASFGGSMVNRLAGRTLVSNRALERFFARLLR